MQLVYDITVPPWNLSHPYIYARAIFQASQSQLCRRFLRNKTAPLCGCSLVLLRSNLAEVFKRKTTMLPEGFCIKPTVNTVTTFLVVY